VRLYLLGAPLPVYDAVYSAAAAWFPDLVQVIYLRRAQYLYRQAHLYLSLTK
jgi:hypothetical protein